jgi:hypothetical protein
MILSFARSISKKQAFCSEARNSKMMGYAAEG